MTAPTPNTGQPRWSRVTPDRSLVALLALVGFLFLSERFRWFAFNEKKGWTVLIAVAIVGVALVLMALWFAASLLFRWRFQFSIRSILVLVIVVSIPCSRLAVDVRQAEEQKRAVEEIKQAGGDVGYDYQLDKFGRLRRGQPPGPEWLRKLLGEDFLANVSEVWLFDQQVFRHANRQLPLDSELVNLKSFSELTILELRHIQITDAGLANLEGMAHLQVLDLSDTNITDAGLLHLKELIQLQELVLRNTKITDAGLIYLQGLTALAGVNLQQTNVTDEGVAKLQKALPNCKIEH